MTIHIAIGNSDDKLTQQEWAEFCREVDGLCHYWSTANYGSWYSLPDDPWQNACWSLEATPNAREQLRKELVKVAKDYRQDSIAWNESETEFLA